MTRESVIAGLKQLVANPASISLHLFISLAASALILLLERE